MQLATCPFCSEPLPDGSAGVCKQCSSGLGVHQPFGLVSQRRLSRRTMLAGLAGVAVAGSAMAWLEGCASTTQTLSTTRPAPTSPSRSALAVPVYTYHGHTAPVWAVKWSPDGKRIVSGSEDKTAQVWDALTGAHVTTYRGHADNVFTLSWSPDSTQLVSGCANITGNPRGIDKTAQIWNASTGATILIYRGHTNDVHSVDWAPNGMDIVSASADNTTQWWRSTDGILGFSTRNICFYAIWSPNSEWVAAVGPNDSSQVWDVSARKVITSYMGSYGRGVWNAAWAPDGKRIASSVMRLGHQFKVLDTTIDVWEAATGRTLLTFNDDHTDATGRITWSPDGRYLVEGSKDNTTKVYDATSGHTVFTYPRGAYGVSWSPDGKYIAGANPATSAVDVWQAPS
jgi:WD40 repeat protein